MSGRAHVDGRGGDAQMGWGNPKLTEGVRGGGRIAHVYDGALKCFSFSFPIAVDIDSAPQHAVI